ncbi:MAG: hypothetical protein H6738_18870 [Alphaproteobacteria bacterium]|nr:hypothetical protein [Alphaproteobacteria bacterium]MCB9698851.1 hypothetical protein [Alphaproteobacteria bacterium]
MLRFLPLVYLSVLALEAAVLVPAYVLTRPSSGSLVNLIVGGVGLACMIGMLVYSIARRSRLLRSWMRLSTWLHLHIFLGLQGILLAYVHCLPLLWRHGWPILVNPGMLNLYAVTVVFLSGLFGRYLYAQVPKTLGGQHLQLKEVEEELASMTAGLPEGIRTLWEGAPAPTGFFGVISAGSVRQARLRDLRKVGLAPEVKELAARKITLEHQKAAMGAAQRVFSWWILLHRPIAAAMYLLSFVHAAIGILFFSMRS